MTAAATVRVYTPSSGSGLHPMSPLATTPTSAALASTPRPIPHHQYSATPANASMYAAHLGQRPEHGRPSPPRVNLAEEEDAGDYKAGGYHPVHIMDSFSNGRYLILRKMGWGHFSTVWLAKDNQSNSHVALKVMKSSRRYTETALDEIKLLRTVQAANPSHPGYAHVVSFLDSFQHMGVHDQLHVCMTFEPLGENLLSLTQRCVKENKITAAALAKQRRSGLQSSARRSTNPNFTSLIDLAVPPHLVKSIAKQILLGMDYLHSECKLIHTDLKPENILVALEDVEEVVRMELEMFPTSESIKASALTQITFPPSHGPRPTSPSSLHYQNPAANQVYIFSSQPLSSPSRTPIGSLSNSPMERLSMRMTALGLGADAAPKAPPPNGMELGTGPATTAPSSAMATATLSCSPSGVSAASLMASAQTSGEVTVVAPNPAVVTAISTRKIKVVDLGDEVDDKVDEVVEEDDGLNSMSSSLNTATTFSQPITPTTDLDSGSLTLGTPSSCVNDLSFAKPGIPLIVRTSADMVSNSGRELSVCDDRTETDTVVDDNMTTREATPSSWTAANGPATTTTTTTTLPATGPSLLSQTAPKSTPEPSTEEPARPTIRVKIADLGNATPINHHFTNDIQTRQYRSPEAILGMETWDERVDVWSVACVVFELLTGEYLFNPKSRQGCWGKDDDHVAQIVELVGDGFSKDMKTSGRWSREIWRSNGSLRHINRLNYWPLRSVMADKYDYKPEDAVLFGTFMEPMLAVDGKHRASCKEMLNHPWLSS